MRGEQELKIISAVLFRLALAGTISIEEARALKALYGLRCASVMAVSERSGLDSLGALEALSGLLARGIVSEKMHIYYAESLEEKILELVRADFPENAGEKTAAKAGQKTVSVAVAKR